MGLMHIIKSLDTEELGLHVVTDEELEKLHSIILEMLVDISEICEKHNIDWSLSGGSMLGAVRHKGFIPWDDDADIFMTRENFEKFRKVFPGSYSKKYGLKLPGDKGYICNYPRIMKKNTHLLSIQSNGKAQELFIDIFILENTYDNKIFRYIHGIECSALLFIDSAVRMRECRKFILQYGGKNKKLLHAVNLRALFGTVFSFFSVEKWMKISDKCFSKVRNKSSRLVVCPTGSLHYFGEIFQRDKLCKTVKVPFESAELRIPCGYRYYLNLRYGKNYMVMPPEDKRERHVYVEFDLGDHNDRRKK